ncbi:hypothetical protein DFI02_110145 [Rhizobium sp. PP-F2F-G20b]|nr:hypothetical protein DFI02_110145 [Rhizobium sp. PP-F2F-G20b]
MRAKAFILGVITLMLTLCGVSHAKDKITVAKAVQSAQDGEQSIGMMILGIGRGIEVSNAALGTKERGALYCPPKKLGMTGNMFVDIVANYVKDNPAIGAEGISWLNLAVLYSLQESFPCPD